MITKLSHAAIYVLDQDEAKDFYVTKLGFEVRTDVTMEGFRWLTVGPLQQPDLEIILMQVAPGYTMTEDTANQMKELIKQGAMGAGVLETDDCKGTYEALKQKGVSFKSPPSQRPYGIEAVLVDNSGNWFSLTQRT